MNTNPSCIHSVDDEPFFQKPKATEALKRAKLVNQDRKNELMIDSHTKIMVTDENFNPAYAETWKANHEKYKFKKL